jgi:hypothetical protein
MGRRKSLSPTSAVTTPATTTARLAPSRAGTPGALDHLRRLRIDDMIEMSTALLKTHLTIVHRHLLDAQISLHSVVFP